MTSTYQVESGPEIGPTFEETFERYYGYVRSGCARHLSDLDLVEEAAQRVWVEFWQSYDPSIGTARPYLASLITTKSVDVWRETRREVVISDLEAEGTQNDEEEILERLTALFFPSAEEELLHSEEDCRFLEMVEAVRLYILQQPQETIEAIDALLQEGRRVSGSPGGHVGEDSPPNLSEAYRSRLKRFREKLRSAFTYWRDDWGATCNLRSLHPAQGETK